MTCGAILVHGYHPGAEDAEIYIPGVLKLVHPTLFTRNTEFFESHAGLTIFPRLVAASIRIAHAPADWMLLAWQILSVFLFLWGCLRLARLCFHSRRAVWSGVALVAALLTMPVAGTALYLMDQYLTSRSISAPLALFAASSALEGRLRQTFLWVLLMALVHPLMALFAAGYAVVLFSHLFQRRTFYVLAAGALPLPLLTPVTFFPPVTPAYRAVLQSHPYFLLTNWSWYEWLGIVGPIAVLLCFARVARQRRWQVAKRACEALVVFELAFLALALIVSMPGKFERFAELQPMRCLHLIYTVMLLVGGGLLGTYVLKDRAWRWAVLFVPLCGGMFLAQRHLFASSDHLELPGLAPRNDWVRAFSWARTHTPENAFFALDPDYAALPGEDEHGFRVLARRSMLADNGKDSGAVSMFPAIAREWRRQVDEERGWTGFGMGDFERLKAREGVDWVIVQSPPVSGLRCPYKNATVAVCRIE